jgi:crotonobetainyl-CoA:carnitine CoA-transferase CaiB-like acyl-CoA transferase
MLGERPVRGGSRDPYSAPASLFPAADGHVYIHGGTDALFPRLCGAIGRPELPADPRFASIAARLVHVEAIEAEVTAWTATRPGDEIETRLAEAGVPCAVVADVERVVASPQLRAREMFVEVAGTPVGTAVLTGLPVKLDGTPGSIRTPPPAAGADNDRVYRDVVGLGSGEIDALRDQGAI